VSWLGLTGHSSSESTLDHRSGFRHSRSVGPAFRPEPRGQSAWVARSVRAASRTEEVAWRWLGV